MSAPSTTGSAAARQSWWSSLWHSGGVARGDLAGGLTAALVMLAVEGSYGLVAFAQLGAEQAQAGFVIGVATAAIGTLVTLLAGGRGPLLSGSTAALALLVPSLIGALAVDLRFTGPDGKPLIPLLLAFVAFGLVLAGLMQIVLGLARLGRLVRYVPYPVHAGYMNGVAVLMVVAMSAHLLGMPAGTRGVDWRQVQPLAPLVALTALWLALRAPTWTRRVPPYLTALLAATGLHHLLAATPAAPWLGPLFNAPALHWPGLGAIAPLADHLRDGLVAEHIWVVLQFAAAVAIMSSLQTALSGSTIDELTRTRGSRERELFGQGVANAAVGALGGIPTAVAVSRTKVNLDAGGRTGASRLIFGVGLLVALVLGLRLLSWVPMAAIAGIFVAVAFTLVDAWTRRATAVLWRQAWRRRVPRLLAQSYGAMLLVAAIAIFVSLPIAIAVGTLLAILLFIRSNSKAPIRQIVFADQRTSRKVRPAPQAELLRRNGRRIVLIELDGALFFGSAEAADEEIERLAHGVDQIVLDCARVTEVDASGARVLLNAAESVHRAGKRLLLAGLPPRDGRTRMIRDMDVHARLADGHFFADADRALEHAEDHLLATLAPAAGGGGPLRLEQTLLGSGLSADELALLAGLTVERRVTRGEPVFRQGEPGDAMYVSLQGQIGIWLPAGPNRDERRMVSFAPGVTFGEIGLVLDQPRSADAIAEEDALVLELSRAHFERIAAENPALLGKLLRNVMTLMSSRVLALTDELRAAQAAR
jgi:SulP family sulfate permease